MKRLNFSVVGLAMAVLLTACGSMGGKFDKAAVEKVKSVAIVGYTMDYSMDLGDSLKSAVLGKEKTMGMGGKMDASSVESPVSKAGYDQVVKALKGASWKVIGADEAAASSTLKAFNGRSVKTGFLPLQSRHERQERTGIPHYHHIGALAAKDPAQMKAIARELGVDAVAFVYVDTNVGNSFSLGPIGLGTYEYSSSMIVDIWDPRSDQIIAKLAINGDGVKEDKTPKTFEGNVTMANTFTGVQAAARKLTSTLKEKM